MFSRKLLAVIISVIIAFAMSSCAYAEEPLPTMAPFVAKATAQPAQPTKHINTVYAGEGVIQLKLTCVGDCTFGGNVKKGDDLPFVRTYNKNGPEYFFKNVRNVFETDDITIVNLEGPLTASTQMREGRKFNFRGSPEYVKILSSSSVEAANLANNHAYDYSKAGFDETVSVLKTAGIAASGYDEVAFFQVKGLTIGSVGYTQWRHTKEDMVEGVKEAKKHCDVLLVSVHWGDEGLHTHTSVQKANGHALIDAGADVVIGTHSHVYGGVERYKDKMIVYSLGNFCFGGNTNPAEKNSFIYQEVLNYDTATGQVTDGGINLIPVRISGNDKKNDYQPYIQTGDRANKLIANIESVSETKYKDLIWLDDSYELQYGLVDNTQVKQGHYTK